MPAVNTLHTLNIPPSITVPTRLREGPHFRIFDTIGATATRQLMAQALSKMIDTWRSVLTRHLFVWLLHSILKFVGKYSGLQFWYVKHEDQLRRTESANVLEVRGT